MAQKVRQSTIDLLNKQGMAKNLAQAKTSKDPEFLEAIRRYYPGKSSSTSSAATKAGTSPASRNSQSTPGVKRQEANSGGNSQAAVQRRLSQMRSGTNPDYQSTADESMNTGSYLLRKAGDFLSQNNPKNQNSNYKKWTGQASSASSSASSSKNLAKAARRRLEQDKVKARVAASKKRYGG